MIGFFNVLKPTGLTSSDVVVRIKRIVHQKRVGHLGTLDPAGSGVLPIAVGKATRLFDYFLNKQKRYYAIFQFGIETDTLDSFGKIIKKTNLITKKCEIDAVLHNFLGEIEQIPPKYSAISIDGKRAYDLAKTNVEFEIKPRRVTIFDIHIVEELAPNLFAFDISCSAGTYIRSLARDIAKSVDNVATMDCIIRLASGCFLIDNAKTLDEIASDPLGGLIPIESALSNIKTYSIDDKTFTDLINGVDVDIAIFKKYSGEFLLKHNNDVIGLYSCESGKLICNAFLFDN